MYSYYMRHDRIIQSNIINLLSHMYLIIKVYRTQHSATDLFKSQNRWFTILQNMLKLYDIL